MNTITIKNSENKVYGSEKNEDGNLINHYELSVESTMQEIKYVVAVNENDSCNDFSIECYDDWIVVKRLRNIVTLAIQPNTDFPRWGTVKFYQNLNPGIYFNLYITQEATDYQVKCVEITDINHIEDIVETDLSNEIEIKLDPLLNGTPNASEPHASETKYVYLDVKNGTPLIQRVKEYVCNGDRTTRVKYDNGLKLELDNKSNILKIVNYGKVNRHDDFYYLIEVKNRQNIHNEATIKITYQ